MAGHQPEEHVPNPVVTQVWEAMTFLHWAYEPAAVAALLPDGLVPDLRAGEAWVGLTPFLVRDVRLRGVPLIGPAASYPETNVRTYVKGPDGRDGIFFLTVEAGDLATSVATRALGGVPYRWSDMRVVQGGGATTYTSRRRARSGSRPGHRITVRCGEPAARDDELAGFLTGRWRAWVERGSTLLAMPVEHEPWPLRRAEVLELEEDLLAACGLPAPAAAPIVHCADPVRARLGTPRAVHRGAIVP